MKVFHGLLHRSVSLALVVSLLLPGLSAFAQEPPQDPPLVNRNAPPAVEAADPQEPPAAVAPAVAAPVEPAPAAVAPVNPAAAPIKPGRFDDNDRAVIEAQIKKLAADGKESYGQMAVRFAGEGEKDSWRFWPFIVASLGTSSLWYFERWRGYVRHSRSTVETLLKYGNAAEVEKIQADVAAKSARVKELLNQAKLADVKVLFERLPENLKADFLKAKGIQTIDKLADVPESAVTLQHLADAINDFHQSNVRQYEMLKDLTTRAEKALGLKAGTLKAKLANPDQFLSEATGVASRVGNQAAWNAELARFETELVQEVGARNVRNLKRGLSGAGLGQAFSTHGVPWFTWPLVGGPSKLKHLRNRMIRSTAPLLVTGTLFLGAYFTMRFMTEEPLRLEKQAAGADHLATQSQLDALLREVTLTEDALTLAVEIQWYDLKQKYKKHKQFTLPCPVNVGDKASVKQVQQAHLFAQMHFLQRRKDPTEKQTDEDKEALQKVQDLAKYLEIPPPPVDLELSTAYYRVFWMAFLSNVRELPRYQSLKNLLPVRDQDTELLNPESRMPTLEEIVDQLAVSSASAMLRASHFHAHHQRGMEVFSKLKKKDQDDYIKKVREVEKGEYADHAVYLEASLKRFKQLEEAGLVDSEKEPLPLDEKEAEVPVVTPPPAAAVETPDPAPQK